MITGGNTWSQFAVAADGSKGGVFKQRNHSLILRMIKIIAGNAALLAFNTLV